MADDTSKFRLGLFILSGLGVLVAALILLGGAKLLQPSFRAVTVFDESVQGLEIGSPVKMRGLQVGKVSAMRMRKADPYIEVEMELYLEGAGFGKRDEIAHRLGEEVKKSAACSLQYAGITGMKYIEIDYDNDRRKPRQRLPRPLPATLPANAFFLPSVKSTLSSISSNIMTMADKLSQLDVSATIGKLDKSLTAVSNLVGSDEARETVANLRSLSARLDLLLARMGDDDISSTVTEARALLKDVRQQLQLQGDGLAATLTEVRQAAASLKQVSQSAGQQLEGARLADSAAKLRETLDEMQTSLKAVSETGRRYQELAGRVESAMADARLKETSASVRDMMLAGRDSAAELNLLQRDLRLSLSRLASTLDAVESWVEYLDEDPASLLRGKQKQTPFREGP